MYIYSSTLYEPVYEYLKSYYKHMENMINHQTNQVVKIGHFLDLDEKIVSLENLDKTKTHITVFDNSF